jgi:predicted DNA-binding ribbon-helix-helix protein
MIPVEQTHSPEAVTQKLQSAIIKRSIVIAGRKTSVSLEDAFWGGLKQIAQGRKMTLSDIVGYIDGHRPCGNLSSNIRLFVLEYTRAQREVAARNPAVLPSSPDSAIDR